MVRARLDTAKDAQLSLLQQFKTRVFENRSFQTQKSYQARALSTVVYLIGDDDENDSKRVKIEHQDFEFIGTSRGSKTRGASGSLETEILWPGRISIPKVVAPEESEVRWP
jgi:hypothetical protein